MDSRQQEEDEKEEKEEEEEKEAKSEGENRGNPQSGGHDGSCRGVLLAESKLR